MQSDGDGMFGPIGRLYEIGGPILVLLMLVSVAVMAAIIFKALQYRSSKVGARSDLQAAARQLKSGDTAAAHQALSASAHFLAPVFVLGLELAHGPETTARLEAEAEQRLAPLEKGFRFLDIVAQLSPLLGLLGTVIGMIEAFQALQEAGAQVDPTALAGGIWVALLTTAAGLGVTMPTSIALAWFEARIDAERVGAEYLFSLIATAPAAGISAAGTQEVTVQKAALEPADVQDGA
ncbi:MAG: MotA/TolQ/ExbB proton channel family protein [Pseudomonadota bacterium]